MRAWALLGALVLFPGGVFAQADDDWGDDSDAFGFDDVPDIEVKAPPPLRPWSLTGFFRSDWGLWVERFDDHPWAKGRQSLDLQFTYKKDGIRVLAGVHGEYDLAYLPDADRFDEGTLDAYQARVIPGEQYIAAPLGPLEITLGRQIVAWGEADMLGVLDVINPRDMREPGLADIDDLRLPLLASRVGAFVGKHRFEAAVTHQADFGELPPPLGEFGPFGAVLGRSPEMAVLLEGREIDLKHEGEGYDPAHWGYFFRWLYQGEGLDLGLYAANARDGQGAARPPEDFDMLGGLLGALTLDDLRILAMTEAVPDRFELVMDHRRQWLFGTSGAMPSGDWLFKWELAATLDRAFNTADLSAAVPEIAVQTSTLLTGVLGVTYSGIADTTVGLEASQGHLVDDLDGLLFPVDAPSFALRILHNALRERLRLVAAASVIGLQAEHGWFARVEGTYELADALKATLGYVHYGPGADDELGPFSAFTEHDRIFARLRWDFSAF